MSRRIHSRRPQLLLETWAESPAFTPGRPACPAILSIPNEAFAFLIWESWPHLKVELAVYAAASSTFRKPYKQRRRSPQG
ncbi:hypothetical protein [Deinococcus hopiensis]|uniref:hypothetical protein n=1 Tax=Deinococcus hopiensis TaxID=309885 RepID=UPI00111C6EF1|nr:hypothetical protein [Deinococcus hopiensis]